MAVVQTEDSLKCALAGAALRASGSLRLRVTGSSMIPSIWPGEVIAIRHCGMEQVRVGDIGVFLRYGRIFAHRVVSAQPVLITQGDAVPAPDPPVTTDEFLGKVTSIERRGKRISPSGRLSMAGRMIAAVAGRSARANRILQRVHALRPLG